MHTTATISREATRKHVVPETEVKQEDEEAEAMEDADGMRERERWLSRRKASKPPKKA